ncbi:hypothetical protein H4R18_005436 [Coemansia javaensis]|uniref:RING-type E3 ubiquitin transferase n=1 Tax=Coemansia javaensis TaxID=2761396 RepID=A0A9W8LFJ9_9FUNG|nr:hypothetical protein H4R18_005436 [Coemansia javaensis]
MANPGGRDSCRHGRAKGPYTQPAQGGGPCDAQGGGPCDAQGGPCAALAGSTASLAAPAMCVSEPASAALTEDEDEDAGAPASGRGLYPPPALFRRQCLPRQAWLPDSSADACCRCARWFTLFVRRHHCRRCGLVFCDACSSARALLAAPAGPGAPGADGPPAAPDSDDDDRPLARLPIAAHSAAGASGNCHAPSSTCWGFSEHRVCGPCAEAVAALPEACADSVALIVSELGSLDVSENVYNIFAPPSPAVAAAAAAAEAAPVWRGGESPTAQRRRALSSSSIRNCPVCDRDWVSVWATMARMPGEGWQEAQERHTKECFDSTSAEVQGAPQSRPVPAAGGAWLAEPGGSRPRSSVGILGFFGRSLASSASPAPPPASRSGGGGGSHGSGSPPRHQARATQSVRGVKYTHYVLSAHTLPPVDECAICFEEFAPGDTVARLECVCIYHLHCINGWLQRRSTCPVHNN